MPDRQRLLCTICRVLHLRECGTVPRRGVFDKSHNRPASSARRLVIEATYPL